MIKMEKRNSLDLKRLNISTLFFLACLVFAKCSVKKQPNLGGCFKDKITKVLMNDNEAKLHSKAELLLVVNFHKEGGFDFKTAVIPKSIFPKYLMGKSEVKAKGYFKHEEVLVIVYGYPPDFLELKSIEREMNFLEPFKMREPEAGNPPFPPFLIEPLVYSFTHKDDCYNLLEKTVATTLLE